MTSFVRCKQANVLDRRLEEGDAAKELQQLYRSCGLTDDEIEILSAKPPREVADAAGISERALRDIRKPAK